MQDLDERLDSGELVKQVLPKRVERTAVAFDRPRAEVDIWPQVSYEELNDAERLSQDPTFASSVEGDLWEQP